MNLSNESKDLIRSKSKLLKNLQQILPKDLAKYITELIAKDQAHQKLLGLTKENY